MKGKIRHVVFIALAAVSMICLTRAFFYNYVPKERQEISILQLADSYDEKTAKSYLDSGQDAGYPFTFWGEQPETDIRSTDLNRSTQSVVIAVCGDSSLVMESTSILEDSLSRGCLIDKQTALELFGSTSVIGQIVEIDQAEYRVAGILTGEKHTVLIQASQKNEMLMDKISLRIPEQENRSEGIRLFLSKTGIDGKEIPIHYYKVWGSFIIYFLPVFLFASVLYALLKIMHVHKNTPVFWFLLLLLFVGMLLIYVWILDIHAQFPLDLLPSKWSDFDFWANLWEQKVQEMELLVQVEKSRPELILYHKMLKSVGYSALAILIAAVSLPEMKKIKGKEIFAVILCCLLVSFLSVAGISEGSVSVAENRVIWLFLPAYLSSRYLVQCLKNWQAS